MEPDPETYDIVVIGSGAASVTAALVAKSYGKTAVIVEKQAGFGGSTAFSGGVVWIPNSPFHSEDSAALSRQYIDAVIAHTGDPGRGSSPARRDMYVRQGREAIQFLVGKGLPFRRVWWPDYYSQLPGGLDRGRSIMCDPFDLNDLGDWKDKLKTFYGFPPFPINSWEFIDLTLAKRTWRGRMAALRLGLKYAKDKLFGSRTVGSGIGLQAHLLKAALDADIPIKLNTTLIDFIEEDGRIAGVRVRDEAKTYEIRARSAVLLNTGGFSHNLDMRKKYQPAPASVSWTIANPGDRGEAIELAQQRGASVDLMNETWWCPGSLMPDGLFGGFHVPGEAGKPHMIIVGKHGRRISNEAGSYMAFGQRMYATQNIPAWAILESRAVKRYTWGPLRPGLQSLKKLVDIGYFKSAPTLRELAAKCGIDPEGLEAEVERFNQFAKVGRDDDFGRGGSAHDKRFGDPTHRPNASLGEIEKPPFYATEIWPLDIGTCGGLVTDQFARVLREDDTPIVGLYATGNGAAPVNGRGYPGAGATIGPSLTFGFVAAKHACGALPDNQPPQP